MLSVNRQAHACKFEESYIVRKIIFCNVFVYNEAMIIYDYYIKFSAK
jgi:hypothetical protein